MEPVNRELQPRQGKSSFLGISTAVAAPVLVFYMIFLIIPFYFSFLLSLKNYNIIKGIFNSPWVGFTNFEQFFQSDAAVSVIRNTFAISSLSIFLGAIYVFLLTLGIAAIQSKWIKGIIASLVILPAFIPVPILVRAIMKNDFLKNNFLMKPSGYLLSAVGNEVFCIASIAVLAGFFACFGKFDIKKILFITFGYVAVRFMLLFASDLNYIISSYSPLVYATGDVLGTYVFRAGLMQMNYSGAASAYIVKVLLQLIPVFIGTFAIIFLSGKMQNNSVPNISREANSITSTKANPAMIFSIIAVIPAVIFVSTVITTVSGINIFTDPYIEKGLINSLVLSTISSALVTIFSFCLAYGMVTGNKIILIFNSVFLLLGGNIIGQYLQMHSLSMINTYFPIIILNCLLSYIGAYFIFFATGGIQKISIGPFFMKSVPVLITMLGVGFARFYGNFFESMIYLNDRNSYPISALLHTLVISGGKAEAVSTLALLLIPGIIGLSGIWIGIVFQSKNVKN